MKSYYADKVKRISEVEDMQRSSTKDLQRKLKYIKKKNPKNKNLRQPRKKFYFCEF